VASFVLAVVLVNLPFGHQAWTDRQVDQWGRTVEATVVEVRILDGEGFVDYRLPESVDPQRTRYSARVDGATARQARETGVIAVDVVPGNPPANRPVGEVANHLLAVVAAAADLILLLVAVMWWLRRRGTAYDVLAVGPTEVCLQLENDVVTALAPAGWLGRVEPGGRVRGSFHLLADEDLLPGLPESGLEHLGGSSYVARGRVVDARAGSVELDVPGVGSLVVRTGPHRIRADIRDSTTVRGTLCFTPRRA